MNSSFPSRVNRIWRFRSLLLERSAKQMNLSIEYLRNGALVARVAFQRTARDATHAAEAGIVEHRAKAARIADTDLGGELLALVEKKSNPD